MAVLLLTFTHALDAQAANLAEATTAQLPGNSAPRACVGTDASMLAPALPRSGHAGLLMQLPWQLCACPGRHPWH